MLFYGHMYYYFYKPWFVNFRLFRGACNGCGLHISPNELVMRAQGYVYHLQCFVCIECGQPLQRGDYFVIRDGQLFCRLDFEKEFHMYSMSPKSKLWKQNSGGLRVFIQPLFYYIRSVSFYQLMSGYKFNSNPVFLPLHYIFEACDTT